MNDGFAVASELSMEYVYAAAILHELDREINEENMTSVLEAAGASVSESRVKAVIAALEDIDIDEAAARAGGEPPVGDGETPEAVPEGTTEETLPDTVDDEDQNEATGEEDDEDEGGRLFG
jgi:large subunit ribosomal protein L12